MAKATKQETPRAMEKTNTPTASREDMQAIWQHLSLGVGSPIVYRGTTPTDQYPIERSNTPTDQYPKDGDFERAHHCQNNSRR
jgi:hypothetical protein